jgi:hypothetical protein
MTTVGCLGIGDTEEATSKDAGKDAGGWIEAGTFGGSGGTGAVSTGGAGAGGGAAGSGAIAGSAGAGGVALGGSGGSAGGGPTGGTGSGGLGPCPYGFGNCDGNDANGCETGLLNDVVHCGSCVKQCNLTSAIAACSAGQCVVQSCLSGKGNCDGNDANGCETNVTNNLQHCGTCGNVCALQHATAACTSGTCKITACTGDYKSCDGLDATGCEHNVESDTANCGECGYVCAPGFICNASCTNTPPGTACAGSTECQCDSDSDFNLGFGGTCLNKKCRCGGAVCQENERCVGATNCG